MPTERDPATVRALAWRVHHPDPRVRLDAVTLLEVVDCPHRREWLLALIADDERVVGRAAERVRCGLDHADPAYDSELLDSDFALEVSDSDLGWEWEYLVRVYRGSHSAGDVTVWTRTEDDTLAKRIAVMRSRVRVDDAQSAVQTFILARTLVCEFTRSPRSSVEAARWEIGGRPRYCDSR